MKQKKATILAIIVSGVASCSKDKTASNCPHYAKAIKGDPWDQIELSNCLTKGNIQYGVTQNTEEAYFWFIIGEANDTHIYGASARLELGIDLDQAKISARIDENRQNNKRT